MFAQPQMASPYPMSYMQGSPLNSLGYNYAALSPPMQPGFAGYGMPMPAYGYGYGYGGARPMSRAGLSTSAAGIIGSKSAE